jgi:hypothetical protein
MRGRFSRRDLVARYGPAALLTWPLVQPLRARAQATVKRRFVTFFESSGVHQRIFWPKGNPGTAGSGSYTVDGTTLEPLKPHLADLIIPKGLSMDRGSGDGHDAGTVAALTGNHLKTTGRTPPYAHGESIDRVIAKRISADRRVRYLNLAVRVRCRRISKWVSYDEKGYPVEPTQDPYAVYQQVLLPVCGQGSTSTDSGAAKLERLRLRRQSVLDTVIKEVAALKKAYGMSAEELQKLEQMEESIRGIEKQLDQLRMAAGPTANSAAVCDRAGKTFGGTPVRDSGPNYPKILKLQLDLIVLALELDVTRVATIMLSEGGSCGDPMSWLSWSGGAIDAGHHDVTHGTQRGVQNYQPKLVVIDRWLFEQFAYLIGKLKGTSEGSSTLLDNSLVWYATDVADGTPHSKAPLPNIVAGRAGGSLKTGRYLTFPEVNHQRLLLSFLHALGLTDVQEFGRPGSTSGGPVL